MRRKSATGFTIVELLIVIVVIAILAAITIVAYRGIQDRAKVSAAKSAVAQAVKKVAVYNAANEQYPTTLTQADLISTSSVTYEISANNSVSPKQYCVTATTQNTTYFQTNMMSDSVPGTCIGMLAWWPFNGDANDQSGNGVNGTVSGATLTTGVTGQANTAYQLGESAQYISIGTPASFSTLPSALTYSLWLARTSTNAAQWPFIMGSANTHVDFGIRTSGYGANPYFEWGTSPYDGSGWLGAGVPASLTNMNEWHHMVVTFDGSVLRTYWDGTYRTSTSGATLRPVMANFMFGASSSGWIGKIDDARVYNRALSAAEVTTMYNGGAQ